MMLAQIKSNDVLLEMKAPGFTFQAITVEGKNGKEYLLRAVPIRGSQMNLPVEPVEIDLTEEQIAAQKSVELEPIPDVAPEKDIVDCAVYGDDFDQVLFSE